MASTIGNSIKLSIFGQSHSAAIGCSLDGIPAGFHLDLQELQAFCARRAPGHAPTATTRREPDTLEVLSGIVDSHTCGAPIALMIKNTNTISQDYQTVQTCPRPGHADWVGALRHHGWNDPCGGGHFSGRLTAPLTAAGGIALQILKTMDIRIAAHIYTLGPNALQDEALDPLCLQAHQLNAILTNELPCIDPLIAHQMTSEILAARKTGDSIGGCIECVAYGMPAGIGDPMFLGLENRIASLVFGIPAVKGIEFGDGFDAALSTGSVHNDAYAWQQGAPRQVTNHAGGILGGISTGTPLVWRMAIKPTPSIAQEQQTVDLTQRSTTALTVRGRHDPCIVPRAVPVAEAVCALALLDALLDDHALDLPQPLDRNNSGAIAGKSHA